MAKVTASTVLDRRKGNIENATQPEQKQTRNSNGGRPPKDPDGPGSRLSIYVTPTTKDQLEQIAWDRSSKGHLLNLSAVVAQLAAEETERRSKAREANQ